MKIINRISRSVLKSYAIGVCYFSQTERFLKGRIYEHRKYFEKQILSTKGKQILEEKPGITLQVVRAGHIHWSLKIPENPVIKFIKNNYQRTIFRANNVKS